MFGIQVIVCYSDMTLMFSVQMVLAQLPLSCIHVMLPDSEFYVSVNPTAMQWGSNLNTSQDKIVLMVLILNGYNSKHSEAAVAMVVPTI